MGYAHGDSSEVSLCALAWMGTAAVGACADRGEPELAISVSFVALSANALIERLEAAIHSSGRVTGYPECAGINRHVVGDARALQERK
jgi:hypothetical protein